MSLMSGLYVGTSGLQTSQNALNTTAHNLSNADTTGYVRQQVLEADRVYNTVKSGSNATSSQQVGLGVTYAKVRQVRDYFLDQSYRKENGREEFYTANYEALTNVEDLLDELNDDASFNSSLNNLWSTIQELSKTPDDTTVQRMLIQYAQSFITNAQQVYQGLVDYQNQLNTNIKSAVEEINSLGKTIQSLNDQIRKIEVGGVETANDLRDARNEALDTLSGLVNISYSEDVYGSVRVKVEGVDFVASDTVYEIGLSEDADTGYYYPYWIVNSKVVTDENGLEQLDLSNAYVFDTTALISSEKGTDIGSLRAMLYLRGDKNADYTDIPVKPETPNPDDYTYKTADPEYAKAVAQYQLDIAEYDEKVEYYNSTIAQSVCMNVEAEFDQLVHNVVVTINDALKAGYDKSGGTLYAADDGSPLQIFQKVESDGYTYNETTGEWDYVEENTDDDYMSDTLYSIPNLQVNPDLIREAGKLKFKYEDGTVDYDTVNALAQAFDADNYVLNPNVTTKCSLNTYYTNLVSQVSNSGNVYKKLVESQEATVSSIDNKREEVTGVSSDEELTSMIKFQNAYNAASRYINVINEMLEHIINQLG